MGYVCSWDGRNKEYTNKFREKEHVEGKWENKCGWNTLGGTSAMCVELGTPGRI